MNVKHIVFPFDYSDACTRLCPRVEAAARDLGARVSLVHVLGLVPAYSDDPFHFISDSETELLLNRQKDLLTLFAPQCFSKEFLNTPGMLEFVSLEGDPGAKIVEYACGHNADLIMMPTHGVGVFRQLLLGSTTAKVLHDAAMPVWTSAHQAEAEMTQWSSLSKRMLCAVDLGPTSLEVLKAADSLARTLQASWCVVHAIEHEGDEEEVRTKAMHLLHDAGITVPLCIGFGSAASAIRDHAVETSADLVVIGRGCLTKHFGRLRSNVYAIIRESPCAVLSV